MHIWACRKMQNYMFNEDKWNVKVWILPCKIFQIYLQGLLTEIAFTCQYQYLSKTYKKLDAFFNLSKLTTNLEFSTKPIQ